MTKTNTQQPKRHHFVPRFYLERFADPSGLVWTFDREKKEYRKQAPKNTAVESEYYTIHGADHKKHIEVEQMLSSIEGEAKPIIEKVERAELISDDEKITLSVYVACQKTRVPEYQKQYEEMTEKMMKVRMQARFFSEESASAQFRNYEKDTGKKLKLTPGEMAKFVKSDRFRDEFSVKFQREHSLLAMVKMADSISSYFAQMEWTFLRTPSSAAFITSDNPFVLIPPAGYKPNFYGVGLLTKGAQKTIVLSPTICLVMLDQGSQMKLIETNRKMVRFINKTVAYMSDRFIYARDEALLRRIVKVSKADQGRRTQRVHVDSPFDRLREEKVS